MSRRDCLDFEDAPRERNRRTVSSRNVPKPLRVAARKRVVMSAGGA